MTKGFIEVAVNGLIERMFQKRNGLTNLEIIRTENLRFQYLSQNEEPEPAPKPAGAPKRAKTKPADAQNQPAAANAPAPSASSKPAAAQNQPAAAYAPAPSAAPPAAAPEPDALRDAPLALDDINIKIEKGEFVAILGHNGSGKSTLAKHMNALLQPTGGTIWVSGLDTRIEENVWPVRKTAGMVFQNPDNQLVATVVEEDVAFGPENLGVPPKEIRRRVDAALERVSMYGCRQSAPHMLSGGQKQRVAIAGILAMKPECIVLDEPTAMLDPLGRKEVMDTVTSLNREENITVIHITHFMEEAVLAGRVIVMEDGRIALEGTPREVFSQVERMRALGLDVPQMTELAHYLREKGLHVPQSIISIEEMADALCELR